MRISIAVPLALALAAALPGCATAPATASERESLKEKATGALKEMQAADPSLGPFLQRSAGYAVFPRVGKGGYIVGGGYGRGIVYRGGAPIGYADITSATVGLQIGGQSFMEILAFETAKDLERFTEGKTDLTANLSAVILKTGAAESTGYKDGVVAFVRPIGGAMVEASVGGQQFSYRPE